MLKVTISVKLPDEASLIKAAKLVKKMWPPTLSFNIFAGSSNCLEFAGFRGKLSEVNKLFTFFSKHTCQVNPLID